MIDIQKFLERANLKHGNKFIYDIDSYKKFELPMKINCPIHGQFLQVPRTHLRNHGCPGCGNVAKKNKLSDTTDTFVNKSIEVHKDKYDYSKVDYKKNNIPVIIICKEHGEFLQKPINHLIGRGCQQCNGNLKLQTSDFIKRAKKIHGDKYDYSRFIYINMKNKSTIVCKVHGEYLQTPKNHLQGSGCPQCNDSKGESLINLFLIEKNINFIRQKKFDNCKNKKTLPFDFYLPDYNICIEYDGEQHFEESVFFGGSKTYLKIQKNDAIKTKFCKENNIELLRIKYTDNIETKLNELCQKIM